MSKAFTRETDDAPEPRPATRREPLPPGVPNYITAAGARHRPVLPPNAVVVPPPAEPTDEVRFGATVTVRDAAGETTYRIVGVDETDAARGWISWRSPLAQALLQTRVGARVAFRGATLAVVRVAYE